MVQASTFEPVCSFPLEYCNASIHKWRSNLTGLTAVHVALESPIVHGYFALATEITNDSGAPHTLEHLCFLGSELWPYKGILDNLASRAYGFTNAWTATDSTVYTMVGGGSQGFLQILPVYVDHMLYPLLKESGYVTEVHHINGEGRDAGVVYAEMQGVQNTASFKSNLETMRHLYPQDSGYHSETGGLLPNLRQLDIDQIRKFHASMYQPQNLCIIVTGQMDHTALLDSLSDIDRRILQRSGPADPGFLRRWMKPISPVNASITENISFPDEDESMGDVTITFLGPSYLDVLESTAFEVLSKYLCGSPVSTLDAALVEIDDPLATDISLSADLRPVNEMSLALSGVPTEKLKEVKERVIEVIRATIDGDIDMKRMKDCCEREELQTIEACETSVDSLTDGIITDFLYGSLDGADLKNQYENLSVFKQLQDWSQDQWKDVLKRYFLESNHVSILASPSKKLADSLEDEESERLRKQIEKLGAQGLENMKKKLQQAEADNDVLAPESIIRKFAIPSVADIPLIKTFSARAGLALKNGKFHNEIQERLLLEDNATTIPLYLHFEHIVSNFVTISLVLSTGEVPDNIRPLIPVYIANFFSCPITLEDGSIMNYEAVVSKLERETVYTSAHLGYGSSFTENISVSLRIIPEKYDTAIKWLQNFLWHSVFDIERVGIQVSKLLNEIPEAKREGAQMCASVLSSLQFSQSSTSRAADTLTQAKFLEELDANLDDETESHSVCEQLEILRKAVCRTENMRILIAGNITKLQTPVGSWKNFANYNSRTQELRPIQLTRNVLSAAGQRPSGVATFVPLAAIENSYSRHSAKCIENFADPRQAAIQVALSLLEVTEGPLWKAVRGKGLAYGAYFRQDVESGLLNFYIYRSPDAFQAFSRAQEIVQEFARGAKIEESMLEGAKTSLIYDLLSLEENPVSAAQLVFRTIVLKGLDSTYRGNLLRDIQSISIEDVRSAMQIIGAVFDCSRSDVVVVSTPSLVKSIRQGFEKGGFKCSTRNLDDF